MKFEDVDIDNIRRYGIHAKMFGNENDNVIVTSPHSKKGHMIGLSRSWCIEDDCSATPAEKASDCKDPSHFRSHAGG